MNIKQDAEEVEEKQKIFEPPKNGKPSKQNMTKTIKQLYNFKRCNMQYKVEEYTIMINYKVISPDGMHTEIIKILVKDSESTHFPNFL